MEENGFRKQFAWKYLHRSLFFQGILQVLLAIIVSIWFPANLEREKAINAERADYLKKKEEIYTRFSSSLSFTLTLNDEMRACHKVIICETDKYYEERCKEIISKGGYEFAVMKDPVDVVASIASLYYSSDVSKEIDKIGKRVLSLLDSKLVRCDESDSVYSRMYDEIVNVDYPAVMELMKRDLEKSRMLK